MTKFKSLLYRELRLSRKTLIQQFICMLVMGGFYMLGSYSIANDEEVNLIDLQLVLLMVNVVLSFLAVSLGINNLTDLMLDIKSGWLKYSYTLPITPSERAVVISARKIIITSFNIIFAIILGALNHKVAGMEYTSFQPVLCIIIYTVMQGMSILQDFILYSARTVEEFKKKSNTFGLIFAIIAGSIIFFITRTVDSSDMSKLLTFTDKIKPVMLVWLIPLLIAFIAADYFVISNRLSSPVSAMSEKKQEKSPSKEKISFKTKGFHFKGNLYKELKQNRILIITMLLLPFAVVLFSLLAVSLSDEETFAESLAGEGRMIYYIWLIMSVILASGLISNIFMNESKKLVGYFIIASPNGIKSHILHKYFMSIILTSAFTASTFVAGEIYKAVYYSVTNTEAKSLSFAFIMMFLVILITAAFDVPFIVRFGVKKGSILKITAMIALAIILVLLFSYVPEKITDSIMDKLVGFFKKIMTKDIKELKSDAMIITPVVCAVLYVLSYKVSCALFKKGISSFSE